MQWKLKQSSTSSFLIAVLLVFWTSPFSAKGQALNMLTLELLPYGFVTQDGKSEGAMYEITNEIMRLSNIGATNIVTPTKRILTMAENNEKFCLIAGDTHATTSRFKFVEPIGHKVQAGILPRSDIRLNEYKDLYGITISYPRGVFIDEQFNSDPLITKMLTTKYLHSIKMIKHDRVQAVAGSIDGLKFVAKREGLNTDFFGPALVLTKNDMHLFCSQSVPDESIAQLRKAVKTLKSSGKIDAIIKNYLENGH